MAKGPAVGLSLNFLPKIRYIGTPMGAAKMIKSRKTVLLFFLNLLCIRSIKENSQQAIKAIMSVKFIKNATASELFCFIFKYHILSLLKCQVLVFFVMFMIAPVLVHAECCPSCVSGWQSTCPSGAGGTYLYGSFGNISQWDIILLEGTHLWTHGSYTDIIRNECSPFGLTSGHNMTLEDVPCLTWPVPSCLNRCGTGCTTTYKLNYYGYVQLDSNITNSRFCLWWGQYSGTERVGGSCHVTSCPEGQHFGEVDCACLCDSQPKCLTSQCMIPPTIQNGCQCGCPVGSHIVKNTDGWYCEADDVSCVFNPNVCAECCIPTCPSKDDVLNDWSAFPGDCSVEEASIYYGIKPEVVLDFNNLHWHCGTPDKSVYMDLPLSDRFYSYTYLYNFLKDYKDENDQSCPKLTDFSYQDCFEQHRLVDGYYVFFDADLVIPNECTGILTSCPYHQEGPVGELSTCQASFVFPTLEFMFDKFPFSVLPWSRDLLSQFENITQHDLILSLPVLGDIPIPFLDLYYIRMLIFVGLVFSVARHIIRKIL